MRFIEFPLGLVHLKTITHRGRFTSVDVNANDLEREREREMHKIYNIISWMESKDMRGYTRDYERITCMQSTLMAI